VLQYSSGRGTLLAHDEGLTFEIFRLHSPAGGEGVTLGTILGSAHENHTLPIPDRFLRRYVRSSNVGMSGRHSPRLSSGSRAVYCIDEIDRSLHPLLVYKYLEYFLSACNRSPCQIIVTTHETHLLDLNLLRRDEAWFAEKDSAAATRLYPLTEFNVRKDLQVRKGYLGGRFGAVPPLGGIDQMGERRVRSGSRREGRAS
jgi:putative AbiEii toxin of type IV toxin-antitoxin system